MHFTEQNHPLVQLYGENALNSVVAEIEVLRQQSNFVFTTDYINTGVSFINIKALELVQGNKSRDLKSLVTESFGEAAIATFNRPS